MTKKKVASKGKVSLRREKVLAKEQVKLVIASLAEGINKTKFCAKHGISRSTLYAWQDVVLTRLSQDL
jgi:transposase-like protein